MTDSMNLNELLYLIRFNDEEALSMLHECLKYDIRYIYRTTCQGAAAIDEWESIAWTTLEKVINRYRTDSKAAFRTVYYRCLKGAAVDLLRSKNRKWKSSDRFLIPIEVDGETSGLTREVYAAKNEQVRIEESVLTKVTCDQVLNSLEGQMSSQEMEILRMLRTGYSPAQIDKILSLSKGRTNRTRKRAAELYRMCSGNKVHN